MTNRARFVLRLWPLALLLALVLTAQSDQAAGAPAPSTTSSAAWTHTDLRHATPEQVRRSAAKVGILCSAKGTDPIGSAISVTVGASSQLGVLPETPAFQLACALDAPANTTCDAVRACELGSGVTPGLFPVCAGTVMVAKRTGSDGTFAANCKVFGEDCFETSIGGMCGSAACAPGETYSCSGNSLISCVRGVRLVSPCSTGQRCIEDPSGVVECRGTGPSCSTPGAGRCDGTATVTCITDAFGHGHEALRDCAPWGLECGVEQVQDLPPQAICVPSKQIECDPEKERATCRGKRLRTCVAGRFWDVDCRDLGFADCSSTGGALGEATCTGVKKD